MKTLVRGGTVVTLDGQARILPGADVLIEGERIARVGGRIPAEAGPFDRVIEAADRLVLPGLVNAHAHSCGVFLKGMFDDLPLEVWLLYVSPFFHPPRTPRELSVRTRLAAAEMLLTGTTTVIDNLGLPSMDATAVGEVIEAYRDIGIRACVAPMVGDLPFTRTMPYLDTLLPDDVQRSLDRPGPPVAAVLDFYRRVVKDWDGRDGRVHVLLAPSAPQRCSDELMRALGAVAAAERRPLHTHVLETKVQAVTARERYGTTMVEHLVGLGLVSPTLNVIHGVWLSPREIDILAEAGATVVHNPTCNLRLRSGVAPVPRLLAAGVNVALGTDNACANDTYNLFGSLKLAALLQGLDGPLPGAVSLAATALRMATVGGARAAGLEHEIGAVAVGRRADLVLLERSALAFVPLNDPVRQVVYGETGCAVRTVIVEGRLVVDEGRLVTADLTALRREAEELAHAFLADHAVVRERVERLRPYFDAMHRRAVAEDVGVEAFLPSR